MQRSMLRSAATGSSGSCSFASIRNAIGRNPRGESSVITQARSNIARASASSPAMNSDVA